ncbi:MAG TPA: hypothetical protein VMR62_07020 [Bryobacteraceae bacterium]|jgi:hypothetical protein|nr:hypothetical protein [Bryobacteraceae bacterium]
MNGRLTTTGAGRHTGYAGYTGAPTVKPNLTAAFAWCGAIANMPANAITGSPIFFNIFLPS